MSRPNTKPAPRLNHGVDRLEAALDTVESAAKKAGGSWLDQLGAVGVTLREYRSALIQDLGGEDAISTAQRMAVDIIVRDKLLLDSIDAFVLGLKSPINKSRRAPFDIVTKRFSMAHGVMTRLQMLGLERRARPVTGALELMKGST